MAEGRLSSRRPKTGDDDVGQFLIGSEIGKGSFAQVYMGKHKVRTPLAPPGRPLLRSLVPFNASCFLLLVRLIGAGWLCFDHRV